MGLDDQPSTISNTRSIRGRWRRRVVAWLCGIAAVLLLAGGSIGAGSLLLYQQPYEYNITEQQNLAAAFAVIIVWPITLFIVALLGSVALFVALRPVQIAWTILICVFALLALFASALLAGQSLPLRGVPRVFVVILLGGLNLGAVYCMWRYILRSD